LHVLSETKSSTEVQFTINLVISKTPDATHKCFKCRLESGHLIDTTAWALQEFSKHDMYTMQLNIVKNLTEGPYIRLGAVWNISKKFRAHVSWSSHNLQEGQIIQNQKQLRV
jgi:hypothetical protein